MVLWTVTQTICMMHDGTDLTCRSTQFSHVDSHRTLMLIRSVMRGMKTISSPSQLCLEFTSIRPFNFHRCRPYRMKIYRQEPNSQRRKMKQKLRKLQVGRGRTVFKLQSRMFSSGGHGSKSKNPSHIGFSYYYILLCF